MKTLQNFEELPDSAMVRAAQLVGSGDKQGLLPFGNSTLWRHVRDGRFPQPVKLSAGVTAWRVGDVRAWLAKSLASQSSQVQ